MSAPELLQFLKSKGELKHDDLNYYCDLLKAEGGGLYPWEAMHYNRNNRVINRENDRFLAEKPVPAVPNYRQRFGAEFDDFIKEETDASALRVKKHRQLANNAAAAKTRKNPLAKKCYVSMGENDKKALKPNSTWRSEKKVAFVHRLIALAGCTHGPEGTRLLDHVIQWGVDVFAAFFDELEVEPEKIAHTLLSDERFGPALLRLADKMIAACRNLNVYTWEKLRQVHLVTQRTERAVRSGMKNNAFDPVTAGVTSVIKKTLHDIAPSQPGPPPENQMATLRHAVRGMDPAAPKVLLTTPYTVEKPSVEQVAANPTTNTRTATVYAPVKPVVECTFSDARAGGLQSTNTVAQDHRYIT